MFLIFQSFSPQIFFPQEETETNWLSNSLAPYERRVIELLRNSKDKRARKLAKKRVRSPRLILYSPAKQILTPTTARYFRTC